MDIKEMMRNLLLVITNPIFAILITGSRLFHGDNKYLEDRIENGCLSIEIDDVKVMKLFEILGIRSQKETNPIVQPKA